MAFNHAGYQFNGWILRMGFFENVIRQKIACSLFSCHCLRQWLLFLYTPQSSVSLHDITSWHHCYCSNKRSICSQFSPNISTVLRLLHSSTSFCWKMSFALDRCQHQEAKRCMIEEIGLFSLMSSTYICTYIARFATWLPKRCNSYRSRHLKIYFKPSWKTL